MVKKQIFLVAFFGGKRKVFWESYSTCIGRSKGLLYYRRWSRTNRGVDLPSSVRRIFEGGRAENLRILKTRMKIFHSKTKSVFLPKIKWRPKKEGGGGRPKIKWIPKKRSSVKKEKGLHSNLVRFLAQNYVKAKKRSSPTVFVLKPSAQVTKGEAMPQFRILFYAIYTILVTQRGAMAQCPLNTPLDLPPVIFMLNCTLILFLLKNAF